jgi:hypothetical protein
MIPLTALPMLQTCQTAGHLTCAQNPLAGAWMTQNAQDRPQLAIAVAPA